jgi:hypothetical protein
MSRIFPDPDRNRYLEWLDNCTLFPRTCLDPAGDGGGLVAFLQSRRVVRRLRLAQYAETSRVFRMTELFGDAGKARVAYLFRPVEVSPAEVSRHSSISISVCRGERYGREIIQDRWGAGCTNRIESSNRTHGLWARHHHWHPQGNSD